MSPKLSNANIIIVDDESINLTIMEISLQEQGCRITTFKSAEACLRSIEGYNLKNYDCLITDYSMPGMSGIDLLEKIKKLDPTLEVILVTGENERLIIQESLRHGAFDFLDKPLNLEKFYNSVERAVVATSQRRKRDATEASLLAARSTGLFNNIETADWATSIELIYTPKHELGGDFIEVFETLTHQRCAIFGDISGHDIQSALLSSHFLGNLEGRRSVEPNLNLQRLLEDYNNLLIKRGENLGNSQHLRVGSSLSVCTIEMIEDERRMNVTNCGLPAIYLVTSDANIVRMKPQHHPLGWFEGFEASRETFEISNYTRLHGFTDGLIEFAMKHHWDVLSLIYHLRSLNKSDTQNFLFNANDDILLSTLEFTKKSPKKFPVIYDEYAGNSSPKVDRFQTIWKKSLQLVIPEPDQIKLERFVLACREGVLNAMKHGCRGDPSRKATFTVKLNPGSRELEAIITDPGEGHEFDYSERDQQLEDLLPGHLGLVLISKLVDEMRLENNGACVHMKMKV